MHLIYNKYREMNERDVVLDNVIPMKKPSEIEVEVAKLEFGHDVIETVQEIVTMSDEETAFCVFDDLNMCFHVAALEELYFNAS